MSKLFLAGETHRKKSGSKNSEEAFYKFTFNGPSIVHVALQLRFGLVDTPGGVAGPKGCDDTWSPKDHPKNQCRQGEHDTLSWHIMTPFHDGRLKK